MKHFKINVGRNKLSSEYIQSKQNFDVLLKNVRSAPTTSWGAFWMYATGTLASVLIAVGGFAYVSKDKQHDSSMSNVAPITGQQDQQLAVHHVSAVKYTYSETTVNSVNQETSSKVDDQQNVSQAIEPSFVSTVVYEQDKNTIAQPHSTVVVEQEQQIDEVAITDTQIATSSKNVTETIPSISGICGGDIAWQQFKEGTVFVSNDHLNICAFSIQYTSRMGDKTVSVQGNKIPSEVIGDLSNIALNQTIFITNVIASNSNGDKSRLIPIELNLKF